MTGLSWKRGLFGAACLLSCLIFLLPVSSQALRLSNRSLAVVDPKPSAITRHTFSFTIETAATLGSIVLQYCENDPLLDSPCTAPPGLDVSTASLTSQAGETGFTIDSSTTANRLVLSRTPSNATSQIEQLVFDNIHNPSTNNMTNYVRIGTYASTDGSGSRIDEGGIAFRILTGINTQGYVPPFLVFCVGLTVSLDCTAATGSYLNLGDLSSSSAKAGISQYAGATNDESGYVVTLFGNTLTAGNNVIPAAVNPSASIPGVSQFGLNLRANSNPAGGQDPIGSGTAVPKPEYDSPNLYKFENGDQLSSSPISTDYNRFTTSYVVTISNTQAPGIYTATFTYVATATF